LHFELKSYFYKMKIRFHFACTLLFAFFVFNFSYANFAIEKSFKKISKSKHLVTATTPPSITADATDQLYCPQTYLKIAKNVIITHDPTETGTDAVYIQISSGYINGQDILQLNPAFALANPNITITFLPSEGKIKLHSTTTGAIISYDDFELAIEAVEFYNSSPTPSGIRNFSISIGNVGQLSYLPRNGHYYEYVPDLGITWTNAKAAAEIRTYYGLKGYLATITAADEAQLAGKQAPGAGWIGGSDAETEGTWKWVTGPEAGTVFWNGLANGSTPNFAFWNNNEPNQTGDEDYAHITAPGVGIAGSWNDLSNTGGANGDYSFQQVHP
jgi:hypothetical protein